MRMYYKLGKDEQELTLTVIRSDDLATVYTSDRTYMRRLDAMCKQYPDDYKRTWIDSTVLGDDLPAGVRYTFPKKYLRFGHAASAAQKAASREKAAKMNSARQN